MSAITLNEEKQNFRKENWRCLKKTVDGQGKNPQPLSTYFFRRKEITHECPVISFRKAYSWVNGHATNHLNTKWVSRDTLFCRKMNVWRSTKSARRLCCQNDHLVLLTDRREKESCPLTAELKMLAISLSIVRVQKGVQSRLTCLINDDRHNWHPQSQANNEFRFRTLGLKFTSFCESIFLLFFIPLCFAIAKIFYVSRCLAQIQAELERSFWWSENKNRLLQMAVALDRESSFFKWKLISEDSLANRKEFSA